LRTASGWRDKGIVAYAELASLPVAANRLVVCNVAGARGREAVEVLAARLGCAIEWVRSQRTQCGVVNGYDVPEQLGPDRWAALIAAHRLHHGGCLVVNAGTATTIDLLEADGVFSGGLILPGLAMMREALAAGTADLPVAAGEVRERPTNTFDAVASGALQATAGAIERMFARPGEQPGSLCLLSGGNAPLILPHLGIPCRHEPDLVLGGLAIIAA
jgi:type III pantothenate kinase